MHHILERGGKKIMKKRWFVVVLTIGLLLSVLPLSVLALSPDANTDPDTITDLDGNILGWSDLSTVPYSLDDLQEQRLAVVDEKPDTAVAPGLSETGPGKSLADADSKRLAVVDAKSGTVAAPDLSETGLENSLADEGSDEVAEELEDNDPADDTDSPTTLDDGPADGTDSTPVCQIGEETYTSLQSAINAAEDNAQIDLLTDIEWDEGLTFQGSASCKKTLTISGGGTHKLTLKEYGIYASESDITFKDLILNLYASTHKYADGAGGTANLISNSDLHLKRVTCTIRPEEDCGSGMFLYKKTNLYLDNSDVLVDTLNGKMVNGIYADNSEYSVDPALNREVILNNSHLKAIGCSHSGLMLDPIDMTLNSSEVEVTDNGEYGFSLYHGELTMENSTLKATNNDNKATNNDKHERHFGIYVGSLNMDATSALEAYYNGGSGLGIGSPNGLKESYIRGRVTCEYNGEYDNFNGGSGGGLYVYAGQDKDTGTIYKGNVTIESGATVSVCNNAGLSGIQNSWVLKIASGARVSVDDNKNVGIYNSFDARLTIEGDAYVSASGNGEYGIENLPQGNIGCGFLLVQTGATVLANDNKDAGIINLNQNTLTVQEGVDLEVEGNQNRGIYNFPGATLNLGSGTIRYNHADFGGGLSNVGTAILSDDVQLYNNHADRFGDDIYNYNYAGCSLTFGPTGSGWELDGAPDCYDFITGWYDDRGSARWNAHGDDESTRHTDLVQPGELTGARSLKAAHGVLSTGSLTVRKELIGDLLSSDYDTEFTFELTLDDESITTMNDKWCGVPFQNGKASFTLKGGESITLSNLPAGVGYTVTEAAQSNWTRLNVSGGADIGVVPRNDIAEIVFTNQKIGVDIPDVPILPILPIEPEEPEIPEIPEEPEKPQTPDVPEEPKGPETPKETETLQETEAPAQDQTPGELPAEESAQADTAVPTQPVETPTQNTTAETLIQTGTTDWLAAVLMFSGFGLLVCGWVFNRKQRAKKH